MVPRHCHEALPHYDCLANKAAVEVIKSYSSSFHAATCLYPTQIRQDIRNIYAVVRIADEIVDGTVDEALQGSPTTALDKYEKLVLEAPQHRFHTDLILHAYANTARRCGLNNEHMKAFFRSMRMDLSKTDYTGPFRPAARNEHLYSYCNFTGPVVETAGVSLRHSCRSELTRQGISLP